MIKYTNNIEDFYTSNNEKRGEKRADVNQIKEGGINQVLMKLYCQYKNKLKLLYGILWGNNY